MIAGGTGDLGGPRGSDETPDPVRGSPRDDGRLEREASSKTSGARRSSAAGDPDARGEHAKANRRRPAMDAWRSAFDHAVEAGGFVQTLLQVRADRSRLSLRKTVTLVAVALLSLTAIVPLILGGVVLLVLGVTQSLAHAFGDREWLGNLLGGALILSAIACAAWLVQARIARREFERKRARYEELRRRREARSGANSNERPRSAEPAPEPAAADRN